MASENRLWVALYELIFQGYLLEAHTRNAAELDRTFKAVIAITSTASLGIWAVFKVYPAVWAAVIVFTQIISATSKFLPYATRNKAAAGCRNEFQLIQAWAESKWLEVVDGKLTDGQITKLRTDLQKRALDAVHRHFPLDSLPENKKFVEYATNQAEQYMKLHFTGE